MFVIECAYSLEVKPLIEEYATKMEAESMFERMTEQMDRRFGKRFVNTETDRRWAAKWGGRLDEARLLLKEVK